MIVEEIFLKLRKDLLIEIPEAYRTPTRHDQNRKFPLNIIVKTLNIQKKERVLKAAREKQVTYEGKPIRITAIFSMPIMKVRRIWTKLIPVLNDLT